MALLPPSFLSSSPATVRSARTGAVKEASAGLVRPAAQRGHGPARLDGTRARATVADKVMKSGETAGHGNGLPTRRPHGKRSAQARSWKPGRRRQPSGARERWKPVRGETRQAARCATRTTARPAISQVAGDARTSTPKKQQDQDEHTQGIVGLMRRLSGRSGGVQGRQACAAGIARRAFPWRQAQRAAPRQGRVGITPRRQDAGWIPQPASKAMTSPASSAHRGRTCPKVRWAGRTR